MDRLLEALRPPDYGDYVDGVRAQLLQTLLLLIGAGLLVSLGISVARPDRHVPTVVGAYGSIYAVLAISIVLLRRGALRLAAVLFSGVVFAIISTLLFLYGGLSGQHAATLITCVLIASFCAGARWGALFAALSGVALVAAAWAESAGWLPAPIQRPTPWDRAQSLGVAIGIGGLLAVVAMRELTRAIAAGAEREEARRRSVLQLEAARDLLEKRAQQGEALGQLGETLSSVQDTRSLCEHVVRALVDTTALSRVAVYSTSGACIAQGGDPAAPFRLPSLWPELLLEGPPDGGGPVRLPDHLRAAVPGLPEQSPLLAAPFSGREDPLGILVVVVEGPDALDELDRLFLSTTARTVGAALDRERIEQERSQAQRMESVGRLAAAIAHDFNNLLTATIGAAELLRDELPEDDARQALVDDILLASDRATLLTSRLLAFTGRPKSPVLLDLGEAVREFEPMLQRLLGERVRLEVDTPSERLTIQADRGLLDQVLLNLAVNARDAMGGDGGVVSVVVAPDPHADTPGAVLHVTDTGTGMDEATLARIFEPFFTTKMPGKGTGIGLSTVKEIVQDLGGSISVESRPGAGARFDVRLPLTAGAAPAPRQAGVPSQQASARILLVEDNEIVRETTERALRRAGYDVAAVANGREAIERLEAAERFDLVLSDVVMPEMGGAELARAVRRRDGPPVLLMSGFEEMELGFGEAVEAPDIVRKPFTPAQLVDAVRRTLERA